MNNKRESAVSPVIAVILLLALGGTIIAMAGVAVLSNVDNILVNDVKGVSVSVEIAGNDVIVYPVSGKDLQSLEAYTVFFLGKNGEIILDTPDGDNYGKNNPSYRVDWINRPIAIFYNVFDKRNTSYINIVGQFNDGIDEVIFTGKIEDGKIVSTIGEDKVKTYTLEYNANGGSGVTLPVINSYKSGTQVVIADGVGLSKEGVPFYKWNTKADGSGAEYNAGRSIKITSNLTLHAQYYYVVTFDHNDSTGTTETRNYGASSTYGSKWPTLTRSGYNFVGWYKSDGTVINADEEVTGSITLYAHWTQIIIPPPTTFKVTFNANGGSPTPKAQYNIVSGGVVTEPVQPSKTNDEFAGWYTLEELNKLNVSTSKTEWQDKAWKFGAGGTPVTDNTVLYAAWWYENSSIYYVEGSNKTFNSVNDLAGSLNEWYDDNYDDTPFNVHNEDNLQVDHDIKPIIVGKEPINITTTVSFTLTNKGKTKAIEFQRGDVYSNLPLIKISNGGRLELPNSGTNLVLNGSNVRSGAPLLVIEEGGTLDIKGGSLTIINSDNTITTYSSEYSGKVGGIYMSGGTITIDKGNFIVKDNKANEYGGIYKTGGTIKGSITYRGNTPPENYLV